jgi:hypothetical protein
MNTRFAKRFFNRQVTGMARGCRFLLALLLISQLISCCGPGPTTATAPAVKAIGSGYDVREDKNAAWASINVLNPLDALSSNTWRSLVNNGMVTTDTNGIAELRNTGISCSGLYVFKNSGVKLGSCTPNAAGNWNCVVGAAASSNCNVGLASPSTNVTLRGTWVSLITLDNGALSIVTVTKGAVDVVPVTRLIYKYEQIEDHSFVLTFSSRDLDENQTIRLGENQSTYTASDDYLAELRQSVSLPEARLPLNPEQFRLLIQQLSPSYPLLPGYLDDVSWRASMDGQIFPTNIQAFEAPAEPQEEGYKILLQGAGGFLEDPKQQQVVLLGVDWIVIQRDVAANQPVRLAFELPGHQGLLTDQNYDPELSMQILKEGNLGQNPLSLLIPVGDKEIRSVANFMEGAFNAMGIEMNIKEIPPGELKSQVNVSVAAGMTVLWLERR